jgi:hypothetical protein
VQRQKTKGTINRGRPNHKQNSRRQKEKEQSSGAGGRTKGAAWFWLLLMFLLAEAFWILMMFLLAEAFGFSGLEKEGRKGGKEDMAVMGIPF